MSDHAVANATDPAGGLPGLYDAVTAAIRRPDSTAWDGASTVTFHFNVDLTPTEATAFSDLVLMARFAVTLTLAEWQSVKADAASLKAFLGLSSPTNAQSVAAIKSIIRVLGVIVRS